LKTSLEDYFLEDTVLQAKTSKIKLIVIEYLAC
jgi:hypothetical protein